MQGWVLLELDNVALECSNDGRRRWSSVVHSLPGGEVNVGAQGIGQAVAFQRDIETGKIVFDNLGLGEGNDIEIDRNIALRIDVGFGVTSKIIVLLYNQRALVVVV